MQKTVSLSLFMAALLISGCSQQADNDNKPLETTDTQSEIPANPNKDVYFGDTHIHTVLSFDAFLFGTRRTPDDAYEFAKGKSIEHVRGFPMQLDQPLDFLAVSDHAFFLGMMRELSKKEGKYKDHPLGDAVRGATSAEGSSAAFQAVLGYLRGDQAGEIDDRDVMRSTWKEIIDSAERHNDPGKFTTFIAYEYTASGPQAENLHRNVIFKGSTVPDEPFSRLTSTNPEKLWEWMDMQRTAGMDSLAIPHNPNGSNGWMFQTEKFEGGPIDENYADQRMRNEPIVENSQVKGTSDTHPLLSPNDEWADFEIMPYRIGNSMLSTHKGSYVREAMINGLLMEEKNGINPFKFGVIAASDTHNAAGSFEEDNYWSKTGLTDTPAFRRGSVPLPEQEGGESAYATSAGALGLGVASSFWGASGLAGVWAESNTRDAIFDGMRRKETYSTSGHRIKLRFFGSGDFTNDLLNSKDIISDAYENGVPMGSDLILEEDQSPSFFIWAAKDPSKTSLQRIQIIKGWVEDGEGKEAVIDVACSDGLSVDPDTNRCPDNGASVDLTNCEITPDKGAKELSVVWRDNNFSQDQRAFYYVRVLENPTCRWSTYDAIRAGVQPRPGMKATIQDRAWSSPIWYQPNT